MALWERERVHLHWKKDNYDSKDCSQQIKQFILHFSPFLHEYPTDIMLFSQILRIFDALVSQTSANAKPNDFKTTIIRVIHAMFIHLYDFVNIDAYNINPPSPSSLLRAVRASRLTHNLF